MVILGIAFSRTFSFFGAIDVILAGIALWGLTRLINSNSSLKQRIIGLVVMIIAALLALVVFMIGYRESIN